MSGEALDTFKVLTKTQQQSSKTAAEISWRKAQLFLTGGLSTAVANAFTNTIQMLAYSRITKPHTRGWQLTCSERRGWRSCVCSLKAGKSQGVDNIPSELLKNGGEATTVLRAICQKIWTTEEWPKKWIQSLVIPLPQKGNLKQCQNCRTISRIRHPIKTMLRVNPNRLKAETEELLTEKQASFRPARSTVEHIFNSWVINQKHLQHQRDLFHNFIDFKKAFDGVWHGGLWQVLKAST